MRGYVIHRLVQMVPLLIIISVIVYALLVNMPGDPLLAMLKSGDRVYTPEQYLRLREAWGLDDPFYIQYFKWSWQFLQGNLGYSRYYKMPVETLIFPRLVNTLILTLSAVIIGKSIAIVIGIYSAVKQYSFRDYTFTTLVFFGYSAPNFWLALMFVILFSVILGWLPTGGLVDPNVDPGTVAYFISRLKHLVMPLTVLALAETMSTQRFMRASLLEVLRMDYLTTARSKGLTEGTILYRHALKNALIPVVTVIAYSVPRIIGGSVVIETVFAYPGVGRLLFTSINENDFPVAMAIVMIIAVMVIGFNLVADILYGFLDPRVRYTASET